MSKRKSENAIRARSSKRAKKINTSNRLSVSRAIFPAGSYASSYGLGQAGLPKRLTVRQRYHQTITINPTLAALGYWEFRANDIYDPDFSGTGHQPSGFDQMMALYNHFVVVKSYCTVTPATTGGTNQQILFGCRLSGGSGVLNTGVDQFLESSGVKYKMLGYPGAPVEPVRIMMDGPKFFGLTKRTLISGSQFRGSSTGSPTEQAYYQVFIAPAVGSSDPPSTDVHVDITYEVVFSEPREVLSS